MMAPVAPSGRGIVEMRVPGDKSISHRALILGALAEGTSQVRGLLAGEDAHSTAAVLRALGAPIGELPADGEELAIVGRGLGGLEAPAEVLDCGNSGTTARLLLGLLAGQPFAATVTGDASLRSRPMRRVTEPLARMGARFDELGEPDRLPIRVTGGPLRPLAYASPHASAQVKSALLLAGLAGRVETRVTEPYRSRDHTERMLRAMGAEVTLVTGEDGSPGVVLTPPERLEPLRMTVPGDFSSAAFFIALGLLAPAGEVRLRGVGVNPTRTGLLAVLERMGAEIELGAVEEAGGEPVADIVVRPSALRGTRVTGEELPAMIDEVPVLAVLAARAEGETVVTGGAELRVKETDRITALVSNLRAIGVEAEELADGLVVRGMDAPVGGAVESRHDHRIAMAFGVLGAWSGRPIHVDDPGVAEISYPGFWDRLRDAVEELNR